MVHILIYPSREIECCVTTGALEFYCFDEFSFDGTANAVMLIGSGIYDAVSALSIMSRCVCVCEQTIASLMATVAARTKVVSMSTLMTVAIAFPISRRSSEQGKGVRKH